MIHFDLENCSVDILPVVNGLVSESEKVREAYGKYECYAASMGIENLEAIKKREEIGVEDVEVGELDIVYSEKMSLFGEIQVPSPAFCEIVDLCTADQKTVIPLDMNDYDFDTAFMDCISAIEFTSVHHLAKKGKKAKLDCSSPENLAIAWDRHVSKVRGFSKLNKKREEHIAREILDLAHYRKSALCIIEVERVEGICNIIRGSLND